jgi:hypothetical protein
MNGTYIIEYHSIRYDYGLIDEVVTVDGRSARHNRTPECLIAYARDEAMYRGCWRFRIARVKVAHITASKVEAMVTHLVYEEDINERVVVVS